MPARYEYLVLIIGSADQLADFRVRAAGETAALSLEALRPPPREALATVDAIDLAHFHLFLEGNVEAGLALLAQFDEQPAIRATHLREDLRAYQRDNPDALKAAWRVARLIREYGAATVGQWKTRHWGDMADLRDATILESTSDERLALRLQENVSRRLVLHDIGFALETLGYGLVEVDRVAKTQSEGFKPAGASFFTLKTTPFTPGELTHLERPPEWFWLPGGAPST